jgi:hypothetical protein
VIDGGYDCIHEMMSALSRFGFRIGLGAAPLFVITACASDATDGSDNSGNGGGAGTPTLVAGAGSSTGGAGGASGGGTAGAGGSAGAPAGASGATASGGGSSGGASGTSGAAGSSGRASGGASGSAGSSNGGASSGGASGSAGSPTSGGSAGASGAATAGAAGTGAGGTSNPDWCKVGPVPADLREEWDVEPYYEKYADANGIPILCSSHPPDNAIILACELVIEMVSKRDDVRQALIDNRVHFTVIGVDEQTNDVPEYSYLDDSINTRARGLGGNPGMCAEESILCGPTDRWRGESICVHEFAHTISLYGLYDADPTFEDRLVEAFENAEDAGLFENTYAMENEQEYWGEGVQNWYYTNLESQTPNGVHGPINTREELLAYDPALYALIGELLGEDVSWADCYRQDP